MFETLTESARSCVGSSKYVLYSGIDKAPVEVDCSSFTKWLYSHLGVEIPRLAREQNDHCSIHFPPQDALPGDLVFRKAYCPRYEVCPILDIGHVGFVTMEKTVIHASWDRGGVVEESLDNFFDFEARGLWCGRLPDLR